MRGRHGPLKAKNNAYDMGATDFSLVGFRCILKVPIRWQLCIVAWKKSGLGMTVDFDIKGKENKIKTLYSEYIIDH